MKELTALEEEKEYLQELNWYGSCTDAIINYSVCVDHMGEGFSLHCDYERKRLQKCLDKYGDW